MTTRGRPTSPFWIYRWRYTFFNPSVIHRATGMTLCAALPAFVYFLTALASGPDSYARAHEFLGLPVLKVFWVVVVWSAFYHLLNGIKHLVLDSTNWSRINLVWAMRWVIMAGATVLTAAFFFLLLLMH